VSISSVVPVVVVAITTAYHLSPPSPRRSPVGRLQTMQLNGHINGQLPDFQILKPEVRPHRVTPPR
jgi:hypothetical protein